MRLDRMFVVIRAKAGSIVAGVAGFKCFLVHSGIDDFPNVSEADLRKMERLMSMQTRRLAASCSEAEATQSDEISSQPQASRTA